jgi:RNA polymerase sigma-70 factor (ECF subfamily)
MNNRMKIPQVLQNETGIIQRARQGDSEAVGAIYAHYQADVFTYIYYRVSDQECAEDLTAEVFVRMITKLPDYIEQGHPILAWLYTIARNLVIDHYRTSKERQSMPLEESLIAGENGHPVKETEDHLAQECLAKAMLQLSEEQRQVILLKIVEDREIVEVSKILDRNERAIRSLQHRALAALHRAMKKENCYES